MKTIAASEFKAKCLSIFKEIENSQETYTITVRGRPVVTLAPVRAKPRKVVLGAMRGQMNILGDIVSSSFADDWFDERDPLRSEPLTNPKK